MKFDLNCDMQDGFVLIDQGFLNELDSDMLYAMDILLDTSGNSELIFDFPGEAWNDVRERETKCIREFCNSGKMILWLIDGVEKECSFEYDDQIPAASKWLHLPTGNLLAVTASELIQCLSYPELEMEKTFEMTLPEGWYAISDDNMDRVKYCLREPSGTIFDNIQET
ncbi:MAG: hypothetical protein K2P42_14600 [Lachnospiraceae bacterium]|nr:hypothetical protein [Lachnospiraceae bacterium]MDE6998793.1 hypothetical protein [Lachnospiraceae bacterium]